MDSPAEGSVTRWIGDLRCGGDSAAQHLWERYFQKLVGLARAHSRSVRRGGVVADEEDAALSAFNSFCRGMTLGRFPELSGRDELWRLLVVITLRKASAQRKHEAARKRGSGRLVSEALLTGVAENGGLDNFAGSEPTPELAALVADQYAQLRARLATDALRQVLDLRLEGQTRNEIAERLGCTERTIKRKLDVIRDTWLAAES